MMKQNRIEAFAAVHETMQAPQKPARYMLTPGETKSIRLRERVSQPVFARYLNVSRNLVSDWERGVKRPGGPALRLLAVIQKRGLRAIA